MDMLNQKQKIIVMAIGAIVIIVIGYYYINSTKEVYNYVGVSNDVEVNEEIEEDTKEEIKIVVHVTGAVKNQGIVEVKENARVNDVIEAAGGVTEEADLEWVNLAYKIEDGQKIYIPSKEEKSENMEEKKEENIVTSESGWQIVNSKQDTLSRLYININTAGTDLLEQLPGIGSSTALKIVEYRKSNGKFKNTEELKNVPGIGEAKYEAIKKFIFV
ncbi:MAG: hypothetical protein HFJ54_02765 [Clostridia bacterium]|nr:hypothetical protein [Clostridia bacterium]